ncbi:helix-turn-helix transcriptional regulator [Streptosporangium lutulentum]|uniref:Transcriptional regulator with XRE-family HTH domain n=1 Tax=Streptosporangium lutulentum TaxID=1461250 RepID=A0ABT9QCB1_9ACTN|nr:helix-turn-helix transcriptional regulator [Streptosporangium lutulentum]MDP9844378.1 transcriptional regulator with XRE-family HTH domain [Streptosporangium lutulentum]
MSSDELAHFLRSRRAAIQPDEIGLGTRSRRRTQGLRREDVAELATVSADYYRRLEQARIGPPSPQVLETLARALRLTADERDYLYRIAGREPPSRPALSRHVAPALRQLVDGLGDSPAQVMTLLGETIIQNPMAAALLGDHSVYTGDARNSTYRWFTDPASRSIHPPEDHEEESLSRVAELRARSVEVGDPEADRLIGTLRVRSAEFERIWREQRVAVCRSGTKALVHPRVGVLELECQILRTEGLGQLLVAFTAAPGSRAAGQLRELSLVHAG